MNTKVLHLVDSLDYIKTNCYQHQLTQALDVVSDLRTIPVNELTEAHVESSDVIVSCLRLRTLDRLAPTLAPVLKARRIRVYDQDPWEAFRDDGPHKGAYTRISNTLNVEKYAVTVRWWKDYMLSKGFPAEFVRIWTMPEYCSATPKFDERPTNVAFVGSLHAHRKELFDYVEQRGIFVKREPNIYTFPTFLEHLSTIKIFLHTADSSFTVDGEPCNLKKGLWAKEVDACSRGCYCIRDADPDSDSFFTPTEVKTTRFYEDRSEIPQIVNDITGMDPAQRQQDIDDTVRFFQDADRWKETARTLVKV